MAIRSELAGFSTAQARRALEGLPRCDYDVLVKPLRYRWTPHLAARCEFEERRIVLQVPIPFRSFKEPVIYAARRKRGEGMRFAWASETVFFRGRRDVLPALMKMESDPSVDESGLNAGVIHALWTMHGLGALDGSDPKATAVAAAARAHDAAYFSATALRLAPHVKEFYLVFVGEEYPDLLPRYQRAYPGAYAPADYRKKLDKRIQRLLQHSGFAAPRPTPRASPHIESPARKGLQLVLPL